MQMKPFYTDSTTPYVLHNQFPKIRESSLEAKYATYVHLKVAVFNNFP